MCISFDSEWTLWATSSLIPLPPSHESATLCNCTQTRKKPPFFRGKTLKTLPLSHCIGGWGIRGARSSKEEEVRAQKNGFGTTEIM